MKFFVDTAEVKEIRELADIGISRSDITRIAWDNANS